MTQYFARIDNDTVVEIVHLPDDMKLDECFHADIVATMKPCGPSVEQGQTINSDGSYGQIPAPPAAPRKILFSPREVIETLFSPDEQQAIFTAAQSKDGWRIAMFITLISSMPSVDITSQEFVADIGIVKNAGLLTEERALEVLAGTPASAS